MSWRSRLRRSLPYIVAMASGFLITYLVAAFVLFPSGVVPRDARVPNVLGMVYEDAEQELRRVGFEAQRGETRNHATSPLGTVLEQSPAPGTRELSGSSIRLVVSGGQRTSTVPTVLGMPRADAETTIEGAGYSVGEVTEQPSERPVGEVIGSAPSGGVRLAQPGTVSLVVSAGMGTITVPDVVGRSLEDARLVLESAGLAIGEVLRDTDDAPGGQPIVVSQTPAASTQAPAGARITLRVAGG